MSRIRQLVGTVLIWAAAGCARVGEFSGREVRIDAQTGPPSEAAMFVDGQLRCRSTGEVIPLRIRVHDCSRIERVVGGMCRPPDTASQGETR